MLGSLRSSLQTHPRASRSGGEDRTETHFCFYNVVLLSFCFLFFLSHFFLSLLPLSLCVWGSVVFFTSGIICHEQLKEL